MRYLLAIFVAGFVILFSSCRNEFEFEDYQGNLTFSKNTVYLDTVFTNISSSTYKLKVYNNSNQDIVIPTLRLKNGVSSKFRIMVDGQTGEDHNNDGIGDGKIFYNVEMLAKDSLFVFIEVTAGILDSNPSDFLYTDEIEFITKNNQVQKVDLVTLVQDAVFIYPERTGSPNNFVYENVNIGLNSDSTNVIVRGSLLSNNDPLNGDELNWTNQKPYVIYGYAIVPNGEILKIKAGTRVHFHANSGILVNKSASLQIDGNKDEEVTFEGDRLEYSYSETPGQWGGIILTSENSNNWIKYTTIKNAIIGLSIQPFETLNFFGTISTISTPKINIENSQFYNHSYIGLLARNATITGKNLVFNNCGQISLACTFGGNYNFTHCTINNSFGSTKQTSLVLNNYFENKNTRYLNDLTTANFNNCIIYGSNAKNIFLDKKDTVFNYKFDHCLIKFNSQNTTLTNPELYNFNTIANYVNCKIAENSSNFNPKYKNVNRNQLWPTEYLNIPNNPLFSSFEDINQKPRITNVNLGAYQTIP